MIHHLARAFFLRNTTVNTNGNPPHDHLPSEGIHVLSVLTPSARRVRIRTDPTDARRTVITGRFAEVCATLDRLVMEQEATA